MNPVHGSTMLNFIHWVALHHSEITRLSDQPVERLLNLVNEYEGGKLTGNRTLSAKWQVGFDVLRDPKFCNDAYAEARRELARLEGS